MLALFALGVIGFIVLSVLISMLVIGKKQSDVALFLGSLVVLPALAAITFHRWFAGLVGVRESARTEISEVRDLEVCRSARWALAAATAFTPLLFFDFSLSVEPVHFLTNMAPALHLRHGGVLMVDTYSQYGPGPILATWLAFLVAPPSFGVANIVVQLFNLAYYALFLAFLHRVSPHKPAALALGLLVIGALLAAWGHGQSNLNIAPSSLGMRYLQTLFMVFAIAGLAPGGRQSWQTMLATSLSAIWSAETLLGTLLVHLGFLVALGLRDRELCRMARDIVLALAPAAATLVVLALLIRVWGGHWPRVDSYLDFFRVYNPFSEYWAKSASPILSWFAVLLVGYLVCARTWTAIIRARRDAADERLLRRVLPMTILLGWSATYYVGRSIDYTLLLALLPFAGVAIPAILSMVPCRRTVPAFCIALIIVLIGGTGWLAKNLFRREAPYTLLVHECRDHGRCSPASVLANLRRRTQLEPVLRLVGDTWSDHRHDTGGVLPEAVAVLRSLPVSQTKVTVLLGKVQYITFLSDLALMYAARWHRWPISFTFTDQLSPSLMRRILEAPVELADDDVVIVREDDRLLEPLEVGLWQTIKRRYELCQFHSASTVIAYRVCGRKSPHDRRD